MERRDAGRLLCEMLSERRIPASRLGNISSAEWSSLADSALSLKVAGLLYRKIKSPDFPTELIPVDVRNRLRDAYRTLAIINTSLFCDAAKVLGSLTDQRLPVIALKGLSLAKNIYGDIALRPMSDVDLLVKEKDLVRAGRILLALGYKQSCPARESLLKTFHHLPPFTNTNGVTIELHWSIATPDSPIKVDLDGLWERARLFQVDQVEVRALSPEDQFLHLCVHAGGHLQAGLGLIPLCDLAGLIKASSHEIDWQVVLERAAQWGGRKCVYLMMLLIGELLGVAPPYQIMPELKPEDYRPVFLEDALEQILELSPANQLMRLRIGSFVEIKETQGIKDKVAVFLKKAFPSRECLARQYPASLSSPKIYLCYVIRLSSLIVYCAVVLLRRWRRDPSVVKAVHQAHGASTVSDWLFS